MSTIETVPRTENRKQYIIVADRAAERARRPVFDFSPAAVLEETFVRGRAEFAPNVIVTLPAAGVVEFLGTSWLLLESLSSRVPLLLAKAQTRARSTVAGFTARRLQERLAIDVGPTLAAHDVVPLSGMRDGLMLVEATAAAADALRQTGLELVEDQPVYPASARPPAIRRAKQSGVQATVEVAVTSSTDGRPIRGALVVGRMSDGTLDSHPTNAKGIANLNVTGSALTSVWTDAVPGHWSGVSHGLKLKTGRFEVALTQLAPGYVDGLRHRYSGAPLSSGAGVKVAVIDTGVGPHACLNVAGGYGFDLGPTPGDYGAGVSPHGTHVAGVIASQEPGAWRGVAPGVELYSYRIYEGDSEVAKTATLISAVDRAVEEGCDVINLSLLLRTSVDLVSTRVRRALDAGVIVVAAAGNDSRRPLAFPASIDGVLAVGALGRQGTYPSGAGSADHSCTPTGSDPDDYVADFSNRVRQNDVIAPGVGTISTLPDGAWGVMDGTSQSAPVISAMAARVLAESGLVRRERSVGRAHAVLAELHRRTDRLGFPVDLEGKGLVL
jgi:subtilisin